MPWFLQLVMQWGLTIPQSTRAYEKQKNQGKFCTHGSDTTGRRERRKTVKSDEIHKQTGSNARSHGEQEGWLSPTERASAG